MIQEINITRPEELVTCFNSLPNNYVYRGHSDQAWKLESTLERILQDNFSTRSEKYEQYSLYEFQSKFHLYDKSNKVPNTKIEWLSIMQHYGVPTRIIDFTLSPYVALYFALENTAAKSDGHLAIYAINYRDIIKTSLSWLKRQDGSIQLEYADLPYKTEVLCEQIEKHPGNTLWIIEPNFSNLRLDRQAGCFLVSGDTKMTVEELLKNSEYAAIENYKYIVPVVLWDNLYTLLERLNITSRTIYGDLEGLAKSIKMRIRAYT